MITPLQAIPWANSCARLTGTALMLLPRLRTVPVVALSQHPREARVGFYGMGKGVCVPEEGE